MWSMVARVVFPCVCNVQADEITKLISTIKKKIEQVESGHNTVLTSFSNQGILINTWYVVPLCSVSVKGAKESIDTLKEEIKTLSHKVHAQLKSMFLLI